ncbi:hypothetical protein CRG98_022493 [Punica granatum]|uniref:Reverse transcriptase Ty1/copia-type domain-containing protein n=1 Tax=Punica granatum TaxID=22663 RepID=A0A2I0JLE5_PUNGR|nr:hypothetical protein CRG98_022493 [Punica granatum]
MAYSIVSRVPTSLNKMALQNGYQCLDPVSGRMFISSQVIFDEQSFPYRSGSSVPAGCRHTPLSPVHAPDSPGHDGGVTSPASQVVNQSDDSTNSAQIAQANNPAPQRTHSMEPCTFSKVQKDPHWRAAMEEEFQALINNHTWDLVPAPPSRNIIGCKWVYRIKQKADGTIDRYKARLVAKGFSQREDSSLFILRSRTYAILILVYVDDIILTGTPGAPFDSLMTALHLEFAMKDLGPLNYFLSMEATFDKTGLHLTQAKYIHDILLGSSMLDCKPISSPVASGARLSVHDGDTFEDPSLYQSVVGSLQYLTLTRPDIAFAVNQIGLAIPMIVALSVVSLFFLVPIQFLGAPRSSEL